MFHVNGRRREEERPTGRDNADVQTDKEDAEIQTDWTTRPNDLSECEDPNLGASTLTQDAVEREPGRFVLIGEGLFTSIGWGMSGGLYAIMGCLTRRSG